jgi:hypothetical protein
MAAAAAVTGKLTDQEIYSSRKSIVIQQQYQKLIKCFSFNILFSEKLET